MTKKAFKYILVIVALIVGVNNVAAQSKTRVQIVNSKIFKSDKNVANGARRLIGNVVFKQDSTIMKCDSAYFYGEQNMFEAYSNVHLYKEGDNTIDVRSNFLRHNGNTKIAQFRNNVVMRDTQVVLYTDSLDYDIRRDIGYFEHKATIVDSATTLTSKKGYYYHHQRDIYFKKNVVVVHNEGEYEMYTDTLKYDTDSEIAYFFGPTDFFNDTNYMYAEFGWYNTQNNQAFFKKEALYTNPKQSITADSLFYDRDNKHAVAYSNAEAIDTAENIIVRGNYLEVFEDTESLLVTDSALIIHILDEDSLYMHADTLLTEFDTSGVHRTFKGFHKVRIFKSNFQGQTDSLFFSMKDSIIQFHGDPVLWANQNQIVANYIEAFVVNDHLDRFKLYDEGLIISKEDSVHYNQIKGDEMTGYLRNNNLYRIEVRKKSETIYFPTDEYGILGANKSKSGNITIRLKENKISRIIYRESYEGKMHPLEDLNSKDIVVRGFKWLDNERPLLPMDVFKWGANTSEKPKPNKFGEKMKSVKEYKSNPELAE
ncbi:MAG: hypothetical protein PF517_14730 [Salinivirgaceae bacterium]|jgi:lipopolysaccharide export system protein LptA|nr:hypothetical protein [Salinivirgaceae bacterium]